MVKRDPFNIAILDVNKFIREFNVQEVTSAFIRESSSNQFHPEGLFSEQIFGQIATEKRSRTSGFISLNCRVFHPVIFQNLLSIKKFYGEIMAGTSYAIWDPSLGDFVRASSSEEGADTGYTFFLNHVDDIVFIRNNSLRRSDKIDVIEKYKTTRLVDKMVVIPAGIRDLRDDAGKMEKDSINSLYASLMSNTRAMTKGADTNPLFDSVHYIIQKKVLEIYDYISMMVSGKRGFFEGKYQHRNIARATRNVVTATNLDATSPDSPQYHKVDETKVPLFQAAKGAANALVYWYKTIFYDQVIGMSSDNVPLINTENLRLEYVQIDSKDRDRLLTAEGIEKTIDRFRDPINRFKPVTAKVSDAAGKTKFYYLFMVYDTGDKVYIIRNVSEFKTLWEQAGKTYDATKMRPLTNAEMLYIAAYSALNGTCGTVTRYPVLDNQGIYVSKTHVMSTMPARIVRLCRDIEDTPEDIILPEYPIFGKKFVDALMLHPTRLKSLGADFDGNCLVGETEVEVRFTDDFIAGCREFCHGDKDILAKIEALESGVYNKLDKEEWKYAIVKMEDIPHSDQFSLDKNGARVYELPEGLQVLSYENSVPAYLPVEKLTIEDDCEVVEVCSRDRKATVSTNPSLAVFNHFDGSLSKVTPDAADKGRKHVPIIKAAARLSRGTAPGDVCDFVMGYKLASEILKEGTLKEFNPFSIVTEPLSIAVGMICALIELHGGLTSDDLVTGEFYVDVDDEESLRVIKKLAYVAGLTTADTVTKSDEKEKRIALIRGLPNLNIGTKFSGDKFQKAIRYKRKRHSDIVPVTHNELLHLKKLAVAKCNMSYVLELSRSSDLVYPRALLKNILKTNDGSELAKRVWSDNVIWGAVRCTSEKSKRTVYDLIVPDSKVFAVNCGLIVYDTCSWIPIFSKEANEQCKAYIKSTGNYLLPSGDTIADMCDDLCSLSFYALMRDVPELKNK